MPKNIHLLTLQTFSATGGIQKMARTLAYSLQHICQKNGWGLKLLSLYDADADLQPQYIRAENFKGFSKNKASFVLNALLSADKNDTVILSHINFAVVGILIKTLKPKCQVWLIAHGIEVWRPLGFHKKLLLKHCDKIICVSRFTKDKLISLHGANESKCEVLNNAIDPFIELPANLAKPESLLTRYGLTYENPVIFTLTRLASTEKYKGYDNVIATVAKLKHRFPGIKYIISGKYDELEGRRVKGLIEANGVTDNVLLTGFIDEPELANHFLLADLFVLPSKKEGFGIVFIEALACGLPVLCGNADGSVDAVKNGELGTAIDPDDNQELEKQIAEHLLHPLTLDKRKALQQKCLQYFNEQTYAESLQKLLSD
ncbi:glycosyltransferase family 4 protein [Mucilaginibacter psychrotolerans]|uniref:Glycosyltransferase family 1 protein n=1 Tax=Mucilaginibacter psychrotolerans TaxID=1524096 RepID=A0A4Y8SPA7_9SPHI|nr:glycosyltransferase family 4 protein [Mucilaginibacter psychrotolerans]TFF40883.1 glycosyltransferase family 1 protein [Mucilaginibacter psychrotolerans]